jgi:hypothetical protein
MQSTPSSTKRTLEALKKLLSERTSSPQEPEPHMPVLVGSDGRAKTSFREEIQVNGADIKAKFEAAKSRVIKSSSVPTIHADARRSGAKLSFIENSQDDNLKRYYHLTNLANLQIKHPWLRFPSDIDSFTLTELVTLGGDAQQKVSSHLALGVNNGIVLVMMLVLNWLGVSFIDSEFKDLIFFLMRSYHSIRHLVIEITERSAGQRFYSSWSPEIKLCCMLMLKISMFYGCKKMFAGDTASDRCNRVENILKVLETYDKHPNDEETNVFDTVAGYARMAAKMADLGCQEKGDEEEEEEEVIYRKKT